MRDDACVGAAVSCGSPASYLAVACRSASRGRVREPREPSAPSLRHGIGTSRRRRTSERAKERASERTQRGSRSPTRAMPLVYLRRRTVHLFPFCSSLFYPPLGARLPRAAPPSRFLKGTQGRRSSAGSDSDKRGHVASNLYRDTSEISRIIRLIFMSFNFNLQFLHFFFNFVISFFYNISSNFPF